MPTGYTSPIEDRDNYTFPEFLWNCLRAFDIRCRESDGPFPLEHRADIAYETRSLAEARLALRDIEVSTDEQLDAKIEAEHLRRLAEHDKWLVKNREEWCRYLAMQAEVLAWAPPVDAGELGTNLKKFMLEQIEISLPLKESDMPPPKRQSAADYRADLDRVLRQSIARLEAQIEKSISNTQRMNAWLRAIHASVPKPAEEGR